MEGEDGDGYVLAYPQLPLGERSIAHKNIQYNIDSGMAMEKKQLHTQRRCRMIDR